MTSVPVPPQPRLRHAWWVFLVLGLVVVAGYELLPRGTLTSVSYVGVGVLGLAAMGLGIHLHRPVRRAPWLWLVVSQLLWVLGDVVGGLLAAAGDGDRFPTAADVCYLAGYPALAVALLLLTRGRRHARDVEGLLDALTVLVGLSLLTMVLTGRPDPSATGGTTLGLVVTVAYPQLDILVAAILAALITTPGARTAALKLLVLALGLVTVADVGATGLGLLAFDTTGPLDWIWLASYIIVGSALLHPSLHELSIPVRPERGRLGRSRVVATVLATLVPPSVLVGEHLVGRPISVWPIALSSAAMFLLVVGRMTIVIRQIAQAQAERELAQEALSYQATHDSLTGLPNRPQALALMRDSMARAQRSGAAMVGLLFVDLDGFKAVNDSYGHQAGDEVLQVVAGRMQAVVRQGDLVGRLGGDEFVVLLEPVVETESAVDVAERLIAEVSAAIVLGNGHRVRVGASVGVAISQDAGTDAESLLNAADTAAYRAKRMGRGRVEVFGETLRRELQERADIERGLRVALEEDSLIIEYDPVVDLDSGRTFGYEAQVSWDRPGVGRVPSREFRPVAALSDLVFEVDTWVMRKAAEQLAVWNRCGGELLLLGVDLTARHVARARVVDDVRGAIEDAGIDPSQLIVQITDTTLIDRVAGYVHLGEIRALGTAVSLVDFGTGYSSVRRLQQLPIDLVKLDGGFVDWRTPSGAVLMRLTIQGVQNFGLPLTVSGVTDAEHVALLREIGCDVMMGPYFDGPFTGDDVAALLWQQSAEVS